MSDFSPGPGWRQASDGKWYSSETEPSGYLAPPGEVSGIEGVRTGPSRLFRSWRMATQVGSWVAAFLLVVGIIAIATKTGGKNNSGLATTSQTTTVSSSPTTTIGNLGTTAAATSLASTGSPTSPDPAGSPASVAPTTTPTSLDPAATPTTVAPNVTPTTVASTPTASSCQSPPPSTGNGAGGTITTVAGNGTPGFSGDGGPAISAEFNFPEGVAVDGSGNIFIVDGRNNRVRKVDSAGVISTVAGDGTEGFSGDGGPATAAELSSPTGVAVDNSGDIYIADQVNYRVRKIDAAGVITTVAGNGTGGFSGDGGPATSAAVEPRGVAVDKSGDVYIADVGSQRIRKVDRAGVITTVAGNGTYGFSGDRGPATSATLRMPSGVAVDGNGDIYIADFQNDRIRMVNLAGIITTVAGNGTLGFSGDGGPASCAQLGRPTAVAVDGSGDIYIADTNGDRIRKVNPAGVITTLAGSGAYGYSGDGGPATSAAMAGPTEVAVDSAGDVYFNDYWNCRVRRVAAPTA